MKVRLHLAIVASTSVLCLTMGSVPGEEESVEEQPKRQSVVTRSGDGARSRTAGSSSVVQPNSRRGAAAYEGSRRSYARPLRPGSRLTSASQPAGPNASAAGGLPSVVEDDWPFTSPTPDGVLPSDGLIPGSGTGAWPSAFGEDGPFTFSAPNGYLPGDCMGPCRADLPRWHLFGEFLYLRPGGDKISYAVPIDGAIVPPVGAGPVTIGPDAVVDCGFSAGFRAGGELAVSPATTIGLAYAQLESNGNSSVTVNAPFVIRSLVSHPGTQAAPTDFLDGSARASVDLRIADLSLSRELCHGRDYFARWLVGLRYGSLEQGFTSTLTNANMSETVATDVNFHGGGFGIGLAAERVLGRLCCQSRPPMCCTPRAGFALYGRALASFLAGRFRTSYSQSDSLIPGPIVLAGWEDDRMVPILDIELGASWTSPRERWHLWAGYLFSAWYNVVTTEPFINGVRNGYSGDISETLTFDGLNAGVEFRF